MPSRFSLSAAGLLAAWAAVVTAIAAADGFVVGTTLPWRVAVGLIVPLIVFAGLYRIPAVRAHLLGLDPRLVLGVQLWRMMGIAFLFGWALDDLDAGFALPAGIGDFVVAVTAGALIVRPDALEELRWVLFPTLAVPFFAMAHAVTWAQLAGPRTLPAGTQ